MERNKYIAAIVLGFLVILGLGIISIKLFRAKRSTAPEHEAMVTITPTPSASPTSTASISNDDAVFEVPKVVSTGLADTTTLPDDVVKYLGQERAGVTVKSVTYEGGKQGVMFERDVPIAITMLNDTMRSGAVADKSLLRYEVGLEQSLFAFRTASPKGRVVVTLKKKTDTVTTFSGHLIFE